MNKPTCRPPRKQGSDVLPIPEMILPRSGKIQIIFLGKRRLRSCLQMCQKLIRRSLAKFFRGKTCLGHTANKFKGKKETELIKALKLIKKIKTSILQSTIFWWILSSPSVRQKWVEDTKKIGMWLSWLCSSLKGPVMSFLALEDIFWKLRSSLLVIE